jgi:uncharacterized protein
MTMDARGELIHLERLSQQLVDCIGCYSSVIVAFSGGVDSSLVAAAAQRALAERAVAVTGVGPAVSQVDLDAARQVAAAIGIRHVWLETDEINDRDYVRNDGQRCFYCKTNLYRSLRGWADQQGLSTILSGTNADDLQDYRPGLMAADNFQVQAPLAQLGIDKVQVRSLAQLWSLPTADRPASPCLASRIAYGEPVSRKRLAQIEQAERWMMERGFTDVRVRLHPGELARLELIPSQLERLAEPGLRRELTNFFQSLGFQYVTLDLQGRRSGSLNRLLPIYQP